MLQGALTMSQGLDVTNVYDKCCPEGTCGGAQRDLWWSRPRLLSLVYSRDIIGYQIHRSAGERLW